MCRCLVYIHVYVCIYLLVSVKQSPITASALGQQPPARPPKQKNAVPLKGLPRCFKDLLSNYLDPLNALKGAI